MKRRVTSVFLWVLAGCLLAGAVAAAAETELQAYPLRTADAEPLIEVIRAVIGEDGRVIHDQRTGRLLVLATPEAHAKLVPILEELNVAAPNVRVEVTIAASEAADRSGAGVSGGGAVIVTPGGATVHGRVRPRIEHRSSEREQTTTQTLMVQSGGEARLRVGQDVPYATWLIRYGRHWGYLRQHIEMREVGTSLIVQPRVLGDSGLISIRLIPEISGIVQGKREAVQYTRAATEVTVRPGQTVSVGGLAGQSEFYDRFLVGAFGGSAQRSIDIALTAHIMKP